MSGWPAKNIDSDVRDKCTTKCVIVTPAVDSIEANAPLSESQLLPPFTRHLHRPAKAKRQMHQLTEWLTRNKYWPGSPRQMCHEVRHCYSRRWLDRGTCTIKWVTVTRRLPVIFTDPQRRRSKCTIQLSEWLTRNNYWLGSPRQMRH